MSNIYVFGSNLAGRLGAGSAKHAHLYCGAIYGKGVGLQGNSYAIPTKDENIETLPLYKIIPYIEQFKVYASNNKHLKFFLTRIGCGLAGYTDNDIAPLFKDAPDNVIFPNEWIQYKRIKNEL